MPTLSVGVPTSFVKPIAAQAKLTHYQKADGQKTTPAMAAGVTDYVWTYKDIAKLLESN